MASAQVVETSVTNNSPSQDSNHPDDIFQSRYVTPGFKPFSYLLFRMFDIAFQSINNSWRNSKQKITEFYDNLGLRKKGGLARTNPLDHLD